MKKKWFLIIDIAYWGIIIYSMFSDLFKDTNINEMKAIINGVVYQGLTSKETLIALFILMGLLIMLFFFALISNLELTAVYVGAKIAIRKFKKDRLEKIDFKNSNYYREKIPEYSPAVLSYIDDFELDKKDVVATLLSLELKKKIIIKDKIEILDGTNTGLAKNEQYIFSKILTNDVKNINFYDFQTLTINDAKEKELISEKNIVKNKMNKTLWYTIGISVLLGWITFFVLSNVLMNVNNELVIFGFVVGAMVLWCCALAIPGVIITYLSSYSILKTANPYVRSKKGKEINVQLEGLKKYLKDFSTIDEKTKEQLILWEEYLIYSVIFGVNEKIVNEVYSKIE